MTAPGCLILPNRSTEFVVTVLRQEGLTLEPLEPRLPDLQQFICKRGRVSFELCIKLEPLENVCVATFFADVNGWTRWNWPIKWLASIPLGRSHMRLLNDAMAILRRNGAKDFEEWRQSRSTP